LRYGYVQRRPASPADQEVLHVWVPSYPIEGPPPVWKGAIGTTAATARALEDVEPTSVGEVAAGATAEKIIDENNLRPIVFLELGVRLASPVARIALKDGGAATGSMISPSLLLTNNHVFGSPEQAVDAVIAFNYQTDLSGTMLPSAEHAAAPADGFHTNPDLDYSIVRVAGDPGKQWGTLQLAADANAQVGDDVIIVQHPMGQPKQIALTDNEIAYVDDTVIQYLTDTMPGSSGSPVFNDLWQFIGLHHSGGWIPEPTTASTHYRNEGIRAGAIVGDLPDWARGELGL
jgi:V8-like Glu-specific endopeptidase